MDISFPVFEVANGWGLITTLAAAGDTHPEALVTLYVYVPGKSPLIVLDVPVPVVIIPPGVLVNVHVPVAGKPFNTTLPVGTVTVGCVILPMIGAVGDKMILAVTFNLKELSQVLMV